MEPHQPHGVNDETDKPTRLDRLIGLLMSGGIFFILLPLARLIHPQAIGWIIMVLMVGLPVMTINLLLPLSHWET